MSLPWRLLAGLLALLAAFGSGWGAATRYRAGVDAAQALQASEALREAERLQARNISRIADAYTADRLAAVRGAADLRDRLREQSARGATDPAVAACRLDDTATAARVLPERVGADLVGLMEQAEQVSAALRACQAALAP